MRDEFRGISFPFRLGNRGGIVMSGVTESHPHHIEESIEQILLTFKGERVMEHHIGSDIDTQIFEPNDSATHNLLKFQIAEALKEQEPRIEVTRQDITLSSEENYVYATIKYRLKAYNTTHQITTRVGGEVHED